MSQEVKLVTGGTLALRNDEEVEVWETLSKHYKEDFELSKISELSKVDLIVQQQIDILRAQKALGGMLPKFDDDGLFLGVYEHKALKQGERDHYQGIILAASKEVGRLETQLGIDKKTRDASGKGELEDVLLQLKDISQRYGVQVTERNHIIEQMFMDLSWRLRLNERGDEEDQRYHDCTDDGIIRWARDAVAQIHEFDQDFAKEVQAPLWTAKRNL